MERRALLAILFFSIVGCIGTASVRQGGIAATVLAPGFSEKAMVENGTTAFQAFNQSLSLNYSTHSVYGHFISGINGLEQNSTHYWQYYVDGELAQTGVDSYIITKNVTLEWRLETVPESV